MITQFFLAICGGLINLLVSFFPTMPAVPSGLNSISSFTNNFIGTSTGYLSMIYGSMLLPLMTAGIALILVIPSWFVVVFIYNKIRGSG